MSYLVFLSYSHLDMADPKNWVADFHDRLEKRIAVVTGRQHKVFIERRDHDNTLLGEGIYDALEKSQILLTLVSPAYINSEWCRKEREYFLKELNKGNDWVIPSEKLPVERVMLPSELQYQTMIEFYNREDKSEVKTSTKIYKDGINRIARLIEKKIKKEKPIKGVIVVYTPDDARNTEYSTGIDKEFESLSYDVVIENRYTVRQAIDHVVVLLGASLDKDWFLREVDQIMTQQQRNKILFWVRDGEMSGDDYRFITEHLKRYERQEQKFDIVVKSFEEFKNTLKEHIK